MAIHEYEQLLAADNTSHMSALDTSGTLENTYDAQWHVNSNSINLGRIVTAGLADMANMALPMLLHSPNRMMLGY